MTNFAIGTVVGFLACVWALQATPSAAFSALWSRLEQVQEMSAAASQAYDALHSQQQRNSTSEPMTTTTTNIDPAVYR